MSYADDHAPKAIIKDGKILNHEQLERYWVDWHRRDDIIRRGIFRDLKESQDTFAEPKPQMIEHVVRHSQLGPKEFDLLQQTALKLDYLAKKLSSHLEYKKKPQPVKLGKRGIKIG